MYALIVAAGSGSRMQQDIPKQFLPLLGKPLLYYTIKQFLEYNEALKIVLVSKAAYQQEIDNVLAYFPNRSIQLCEGGETRFLSVKEGLKRVPENDLVFIHDAARPFISAAILERCREGAITHGHAIPAITLKDTIRQVDKDGRNQVIDRTSLRAIQTPQTFQSSFIKGCVAKASRINYTDEANILEEQGHAVHLVEGSENNFKVTQPIDLRLAELMLSEMH